MFREIKLNLISGNTGQVYTGLVHKHTHSTDNNMQTGDTPR